MGVALVQQALALPSSSGHGASAFSPSCRRHERQVSASPRARSCPPEHCGPGTDSRNQAPRSARSRRVRPRRTAHVLVSLKHHRCSARGRAAVAQDRRMSTVRSGTKPTPCGEMRSLAPSPTERTRRRAANAAMPKANGQTRAARAIRNSCCSAAAHTLARNPRNAYELATCGKRPPTARRALSAAMSLTCSGIGSLSTRSAALA
jgi:hypothetical protein